MELISIVYFSVYFLAFATHSADAVGPTSYDYDTVITFTIFDWNQNKFVNHTTVETNFASYGCTTSDPFVVTVHGWMNGCYRTPWLQDTLNNFVIHRKGCVLCMDYSPITDSSDFFTVVAQIDGIASTLVKKMRQLIAFGMNPLKGMLYGFSLGTQVAFHAGRDLAPVKLGRIDACDPPGIGFDSNATHNSLSVMDAAVEVQCIHTSSNIGTLQRVCHKDWLMGYCGWLQFGFKSSHELCPDYYNAAFSYNFPATINPYLCPTTRAALLWPPGFKMGYFMPQGIPLIGNFFAKTSVLFPYN
ncbi:uncharacterized protein LOC128724584 [Anopheles nili]|uniref:uncharacterized protein LOC128724584 n=1 Tax=Anopheles nili TaxID=185578 RepID=UPI00237AC844|nr:uncharacterized protein LOC128724584 [Anopheles nili]